MSNFKVLSKNGNELTFQLSLMKNEKVNAPSLFGVLLNSIAALSFPDKEFEQFSPTLSEDKRTKLISNNPYKDLMEKYSKFDKEFDYICITSNACSSFFLKKAAADCIKSVELIEELPISEEEANSDINFKATYKAVMTSPEYINFLPEDFTINISYTYHPADDEEDPYRDIINKVKNIQENESDENKEAKDEQNEETNNDSFISNLMKKFGL